MPKQVHGGIMLIIILGAVIPALRHYAFTMALPADPTSAASPRTEDLLPVLAWHAEHALRALQPSERRVLLPQGSAAGDGAIVYSSELAATLGLFERCGGGERPCRSADLAPSLRSTVWWPGQPAAPGVLYASRYHYEIDSIQKVTPLTGGPLELLRVHFRWKITGPSTIEERLRRALPAAAATPLLPAGTMLEHQVDMVPSKYGYVLPLTRELP